MTQRASMMAIFAAGLAVLVVFPAEAPRAETAVEQLRQDLEALKQRQDALQGQVEEMRKLLETRLPPPRPQAVEASDAELMLGPDNPIKGKEEAAITLVEFSDYQCPFCLRHFQNTLPQLEKEYIETGKIRYVFRNFPIANLHPQALNAAEAANCAGEQQKYWEMHDRLFANAGQLAPENLIDNASAIGLNIEAFQACLQSGRQVQEIQRDIEEGSKLGVNGTPAFFLGVSDGSNIKAIKRIRGAQPFALFKEQIDALLAEKKS
jgi:protein-disulfide isomerase